MLALPGLSALLMASLLLPTQPAVSLDQELWDAARAGDVARIARALDRGADINAKTDHGVSALWFAADRGHLAAVRLLIDRGADLHVQDVSWSYLPLDRAIINEHPEVARYLLERGSKATPRALAAGIRAKDVALVKAALSAGGLDLRALASALQTATRAGDAEMTALVKAAVDAHPADAVRAALAGAAPAEPEAAPVAASAPLPARSSGVGAVDPRAGPRNWPSFRGPDASGIGDDLGAVADWDMTTGKNVKWKTPIPGIATSSPIVWGDRVIVTTAIGGDTTLRTGHYADLRPVEDLSEHIWKIYTLDRKTGRLVWEREVFKGAPGVRRHPKGSQANSTPVTDGRRIVAFFGSIGLLVCFEMDGMLLWKKNLGPLDSGWALDPVYQFGHASSPIIYKQMAIVQADVQKGSFLAAYDLATGREVWRARRDDEISTWGTPTIVKGQGQDELVTNGTRIRGYHPETGKLLWTLGPNSEITVATPIAGSEFVYVTGGYPPVRPIYAIRPGSRGDISLARGARSNESIAWSNDREGTYIPTPILYRGYLYTCNNNGVLTAYDAETGNRLYRARVGSGGAFSASPVAADGRLYIATEDGEVYVVRAGPRYEEIARNEMHEVIMATPAISDGLLIVRTLGHVYGIGR